MLQNFIIHGDHQSENKQRTEADLLCVRFPHRAERLYDDDPDVMQDDVATLKLAPDKANVLIVEVKTKKRCTLNGPWTKPNKKNVHRVLAAIGCLSEQVIPQAAAALYRQGLYDGDGIVRIRLVAVGRERSEELAQRHPEVVQLVWRDILCFIWWRLKKYRSQKRQVGQWDEVGLEIHRLAASYTQEDFIAEMSRRMGLTR